MARKSKKNMKHVEAFRTFEGSFCLAAGPLAPIFSYEVMIRAVNTNLANTIGRDLSYFIPDTPLAYNAEHMTMSPGDAKHRPLLKCVCWAASREPPLPTALRCCELRSLTHSGSRSRKGSGQGVQTAGLNHPLLLRARPVPRVLERHACLG